MSRILSTQIISTSYNNPGPTTSTGSSFQVGIPAPTCSVARPLSYEFRVAEHVDKDNNIVKVGLQYRIYEHDNYSGAANMLHDWADVDRVKVDTNGNVIY